MLKDFAIEPDAFSSLDRCDKLLGLFAMGSGAFISEYPKKWKKEVYKSAKKQCRDYEFKKVFERLKNLDSRTLLPSRRPYSKESGEWLDNALLTHRERPFGGIVCADAKQTQPATNVISADEIYSDHPVFAGLGQANINRNAEAMAEAVRLIVEEATHLKIIDTHYRPGSGPGFDEPLFAILESIRPPNTSRLKIELHTESSSRRPDDDYLERGFIDLVYKAIPNADVAVAFYDQGVLHNRFLLTDIGGVMWGTGLDEQGNSDRKTETDELIVLKKHLYEFHWSKWNCDEES